MQDKPYRKPLFASLGVHIVIIILLFIGLPVTKLTLSDDQPGLDENKPATPVINAVMVEAAELNKEVNRLSAQDAKRKADEKRRIDNLKQLEMQAIQKRKQEEEKLKVLKEQAAEKLKAEKLALEKLKIAKEQALLVQQEAERKTKEAEKQKQVAEQKAKEAEIQAKKQAEKQKQEADNLAKVQAAANQQRAAAEAARQRQVMQDQISQYASMMMKKVTQNWRKPLGVEASTLSCVISVKLLPTGEVLEATVVESSGHTEFDRSSELAVLKSSPLPMPADEKARTEFRNFSFRFKPEVG